MSVYRITCLECGDAIYGRTKANAKVAFRAHVETEHAGLVVGTETENDR